MAHWYSAELVLILGSKEGRKVGREQERMENTATPSYSAPTGKACMSSGLLVTEGDNICFFSLKEVRKGARKLDTTESIRRTKSEATHARLDFEQLVAQKRICLTLALDWHKCSPSSSTGWGWHCFPSLRSNLITWLCRKSHLCHHSSGWCSVFQIHLKVKCG